ncbi:YqzM family protein [Paenalkalicoccus suaedae]|uniref:YqzM family protein n=1 Tax=Paenalkalicoccus suaedae TaxID=2592382 RepID=A0A859FD46_9BACI|nr:YqzM family protein [Paenalkalicoccus suaedae]QKS70840.1 YqzM family protein [Paenalkalicoccus suaedae]
MNEFEKDVQYNKNDAIDSGIGFVVSFVFFFLIFAVGQAIDLLL